MKWLSLPLLLLLGTIVRAQTPPEITAFAVVPTQQHPSFTGVGYAVVQTNIDGATEYQCFLNGHHFLSLISTNGAVALRPHPGVDRNGWGSSLYLQSFLSPSNVVLGHAFVSGVTTGLTGIEITAAGAVSALTRRRTAPGAAHSVSLMTPRTRKWRELAATL